MAKLPSDVSGGQLCKALQKIGFVESRQKGSHIVLYRENPRCRVVVPDHRSLRQGTLHQIITMAGLSVEELIELH
jgi:predicted RNA binding protein YcfA (HicA-like mRNA interferase family)